MAGNTKFMGFNPSNQVQLARWGGKVTTKLSAESVEALRVACSNLPQKPQQGRMDHLDDFNVSYDEHVGRVRVDMDVVTAGELADILGEFIAEFDPTPHTSHVCWQEDLRKAVRAHEDYHSKKGEPGVEDSD